MLSSAKKLARVSHRTSHSNLHILTSLLAISLNFRTYYSIVAATLPTSLKYAAMGAFQDSHQFLDEGSDIGAMMQHWIAVASKLPDANDVRETVIHTLLKMAVNEELSPHIPATAWKWLKKQPTIYQVNPWFWDRDWRCILQTVRTLGDIELITSCLSLMWLNPDPFGYGDGGEMRRFLREELSGIRAVGYRADLIPLLDSAICRLGYDEISVCKRIAKKRHEGFRRVLQELDEEAAKVLAGMSPRVITGFCLLTCACIESHSTGFTCALPLPYP